MDGKMKRKIVVLSIILLGFVTVPAWLWQRHTGVTSWGKPDPGTVSTEQTRQTFRKWQDANGQWHLGDEVPEGVQATDIHVDTAANIIQSVPVPGREVVNESTADREQPGVLSGIPALLNPAEIPALIEQTQKAQQAHYQRQDEAGNAQ